MTKPNLFRLAATLLFVGVLFSLLVGMLHPSSGTPNNHPAEFAAYASSAVWTAVHLGQFVGIAVIIAGLLVLFFALGVSGNTALAGIRRCHCRRGDACALRSPTGRGRGRPQAGGGCMGERTSYGEGRALCER
jgi:hypothetical protein